MIRVSVERLIELSVHAFCFFSLGQHLKSINKISDHNYLRLLGSLNEQVSHLITLLENIL